MRGSSRAALAVRLGAGHERVLGPGEPRLWRQVGATIGDLCEIGNGAILMPGSRLTDHPGTIVSGPMQAGEHMGTLYAYRDKSPSIGPGTVKR